jgi:hypothetical protein
MTYFPHTTLSRARRDVQRYDAVLLCAWYGVAGLMSTRRMLVSIANRINRERGHAMSDSRPMRFLRHRILRGLKNAQKFYWINKRHTMTTENKDDLGKKVYDASGLVGGVDKARQVSNFKWGARWWIAWCRWKSRCITARSWNFRIISDLVFG